MARFDLIIRSILTQTVLCLVRIYQYLLSPWVGQHCRFQPSCSCYTAEAVQVHGIWKGTYLGLRRLLRCHPWHPGGIDFVPLKK